ncbi:IPT/TIG domain-containing protein [Flagellimonas sp. 389]|uniref:IPT/TIG domain-containing protein n=1 Tax=Flagellimonas sp. 389 TaxID=2835862 RepID=UPI001BD5FAEC|nr:IPT/TIG domain-containing protein [Flagellimonas sp. 389]MBS9463137.1 IPT/TIG domain-containing protein [Flagellimonas sp. 389]
MNRFIFFCFILAILACSNGDNPAPFVSDIRTTPIITSFSPISGPVGTVITIEGFNFDGSGQSVNIGSTETIVISASNTKIETVVLTETITDNIIVTVNGRSGSSENKFTVLP